MHDSPRLRRLRNDLAALERLATDSSVFRFEVEGNPPHHYRITFKGKGLWRDRGKVKAAPSHCVDIKLGSSYPRTIPEIRWLTPIYHPNISEIGLVCLGGYGTHWVPSVGLDELCQMLWDMARYHNYDIRSPYNREAALWAANQTAILFPTDPRPIRDLRIARGRIEMNTAPAAGPARYNGEATSTIERLRRLLARGGRTENGDLHPAQPAAPAPPHESAITDGVPILSLSSLPRQDEPPPDPSEGVIILEEPAVTPPPPAVSAAALVEQEIHYIIE